MNTFDEKDKMLAYEAPAMQELHFGSTGVIAVAGSQEMEKDEVNQGQEYDG